MKIVAISWEPDMSAELVQKCMQALSADRRERILRFRKEADRLRSLIADAAVRIEAALTCSVPIAELHFATNAHGKPMLDGATDFHFNVSHSGRWIVCAFDRLPVGIDIEQIRPVDFRIAERFFAASEAAELLRLPERSRLNYFYELWTLKESYIKLDGRGLALPLDAFWFRAEAGGYVLAEGPRKPVFARHYAVDPGYKCAVCADHDALPAAVELTDAACLLTSFVELSAW